MLRGGQNRCWGFALVEEAPVVDMGGFAGQTEMSQTWQEQPLQMRKGAVLVERVAELGKDRKALVVWYR